MGDGRTDGRTTDPFLNGRVGASVRMPVRCCLPSTQSCTAEAEANHRNGSMNERGGGGGGGFEWNTILVCNVTPRPPPKRFN